MAAPTPPAEDEPVWDDWADEHTNGNGNGSGTANSPAEVDEPPAALNGTNGATAAPAEPTRDEPVWDDWDEPEKNGAAPAPIAD